MLSDIFYIGFYSLNKSLFFLSLSCNILLDSNTYKRKSLVKLKEIINK